MDSKSKAVPTTILSAVFLSGFAVIKCGPGDDITLITKKEGTEFRVVFPDGSNVINSYKSPETLLKCATRTAAERNYVLEILEKGEPSITFNIRCGKNGGWYIADKFLLGGIISILVADCKSGELWLMSPDVLKGRIKEVKSAAMIKPDSDELSIVYKNCVPEEIFNSIPFMLISSTAFKGSKKKQ